MAGKNVLRVGILGQGRSGYGIHAGWLREDPKKFEIVAVSDEMAARRKDAEKEFGARSFQDYRKLLRDESLALDLVVNALPSNLHPKGTIQALNAGHHVVCEKPLAIKVKDYDKMTEAAKKNRRKLFPFQNSRFQPYFRKIQNVLDSGVLGKVVYIRTNWSGFQRRWDWQTLQEFWGGNLNNTGPHPMDHAIALFGRKTPKVFARMKCENPFGDADNFSAVTLYGGRDDPVIEVVLNSFQAYLQGEMYNISATRGGLEGGPGGLRWKYFDEKQAPSHKNKGWSENRAYCKEEIKWTQRSWKPGKKQNGFALASKGFYDNVYDILVNKGQRVIRLDEVRRQIAAVEECHRQNRLPRKKTASRKK